jgi:hypothetical protein
MPTTAGFDAATVDPLSVTRDEANVCVEGKRGDAGSLEDVGNDAVLPARCERQTRTSSSYSTACDCVANSRLTPHFTTDTILDVTHSPRCHVEAADTVTISLQLPKASRFRRFLSKEGAR